MAPTTTLGTAHIAPKEVHELLDKHILADGLPMVLDLEKSHGAYLYDSLREREVLDLFTCFATCPIGYNHPKLDTPGFRQRILPTALNKPSNSDLYTTEMAEFVTTMSRTVPDSLNQRMFFIEGGALAVENASRPHSTGRCAETSKPAREKRGIRSFTSSRPFMAAAATRSR